MFRLDEYNGLVFKAADLKEIYEPIVTKFGFEYDGGLDSDKHGLLWSKLYEGDDDCYEDVYPVMIIRETGMDPLSASDFNKARFFSTSLWWENFVGPGFSVIANPKEFNDDTADEVKYLIKYAREAQKEVNAVLEECRKQLVVKLTEIRAALLADRKSK